MPNANPRQKVVKVIKMEEKGLDDKLSVHLLDEAWKDKYD